MSGEPARIGVSVLEDGTLEAVLVNSRFGSSRLCANLRFVEVWSRAFRFWLFFFCQVGAKLQQGQSWIHDGGKV